MKVGSLFSGIGGMDLGLERAGHEIVFQCESDPYRRRVLKGHWPGVPCFEDIRLCTEDRLSRWTTGQRDSTAPERIAANNNGLGKYGSDGVDLLCGGFPCQDLSVAGRRAGLDGKRSGLFFEFARVADAVLPDGGWVLIENVPGLLSSNGGRDFAVLLATLAELGFHDLAWRVLDSRYLGVPQRRRRVFILARRSRGRRASEVLLEPESGGGDFEAGRAAGQELTRSIGNGSTDSRGGWRDDLDHGAYVAHAVRSEGFDASEDGTGRRTPLVLPDGGEPRTPRLSRRNTPAEDREWDRPPHTTGDSASGDGSQAHPHGVRAPSGIARRTHDRLAAPLTKESAADKGISKPGRRKEDDESLAFGGEGQASDRCVFDPTPDSGRYAACGDAVTANVAGWIGRRLMEFA